MASKPSPRAKREPLRGPLSRDDTGCPRSSKEGTLTAGIAEKSLRFGAATHVACRGVPGTLRPFSGSFTVERRITPSRASSSGASRERRSRDRPHEETPEGMAPHQGADHAQDDGSGSTRCKSGRVGAFERGPRRKPRAEEDGGLVRVLPVRPFVTAEIGWFGPRSPRCASLRPATVESGSRAGTSHRRNTSRVRFERGVSTSRRWRTRSPSNEEAYLRVRRGSRRLSERGATSARRQALESAPMEDVSGDQRLASLSRRRRKTSPSAGPASERSVETPRSRAGTATETSEVKIATEPTSQHLVCDRAVPPKRAQSA
jgi:hypothetical protein